MTSPQSSSPFSLTSPLQVGIVGTGYVAKRRAEALQADPRSHLVTATGGDVNRVAEFCQTHQIKESASWEELVRNSSLDLVVICTLNQNHGKVARAALEAGKHVIVEYPLTLETDEAKQLLTLAQNQGKLLHVEHLELLGGLHQAIAKALSDIGNVFYARYVTLQPQQNVSRRWTYHYEKFGFPFMGALSRINRFTDLFGTVASVSCQSRFWDTSEGYYSACLCDGQLRFNNGLIADIIYGKGEVFSKGERRFELHGDQGTLIFEGEQGKLIQDQGETSIEVQQRKGLFVKDTTSVLDHLLTGKPLYTSAQKSYYALRVAEATYKSSAMGQTVFFD